MFIIFDLDDTLIDTSDLFWRVREEFLFALNGSNIPTARIRRLFEAQDSKNMALYGFNPKRYGETMRDVYDKFVTNEVIMPSDFIEGKIEELEKKIVTDIPPLIDGAIETLTKLQKLNYDLYLITRGPKEVQENKIKHHKLSRFFKEYLIVEKKDSQLYRRFINERNASVSDSWIIGDSIRSDINPGLTIGAHCIYYFYEHDHYYWEQEHGDLPISRNFYQIADIRNVLEIIADNEIATNNPH
ncbi:MAG: HAD hydrolase-like protein [Bacteroidota bacterium]